MGRKKGDVSLPPYQRRTRKPARVSPVCLGQAGGPALRAFSKKDFKEHIVGFTVENTRSKGSQSNQTGHILALTAVTENLPLNYYRGTETILVVDDEESLRTVVVDLLSQLGYHVLSAAGGQEALELAAKYSGQIDLLLTDVVMDGLAGPELAEKLLQGRPEMKVVFISGFADGSLAPDGVLKPGTIL